MLSGRPQALFLELAGGRAGGRRRASSRTTKAGTDSFGAPARPGCWRPARSARGPPARATAAGTRAQYKTRGAVFAFERTAQAFGAILILRTRRPEPRTNRRAAGMLGTERTSTRTRATPGAAPCRSPRAAACERSMMRPSTNGPRSMMRTSTDLSLLEIGHPHPGAERKRAMRGGQLFHVVDLAVGGGAAVIRMAVPTRDAGFRGANSGSAAGGEGGRGCARRVTRCFFAQPASTMHASEEREQRDRPARDHLLRS